MDTLGLMLRPRLILCLIKCNSQPLSTFAFEPIAYQDPIDYILLSLTLTQVNINTCIKRFKIVKVTNQFEHWLIRTLRKCIKWSLNFKPMLY